MKNLWRLVSKLFKRKKPTKPIDIKDPWGE